MHIIIYRVIFAQRTTTSMKDFTIKVPGIDIELRSNQIYHIQEISDADAPDGYQKQGISKHPLRGIEEGIIVPYHDQTSTWNTGFFKGSFCYVREEKADEILKALETELLPHLKVLVDGDLTSGKNSKETNAFFDDFRPFNGDGYGEDTSKYKIKGGNMFNTKNPLEFLALWWALLSKQIMPDGKQNTPAYLKCNFVLKDKQQSTTTKQDREFELAQASARVMTIASRVDNKKDKKHLQNVFKYVGLDLSLEDLELKPLISSFNSWAEKGGYNNDNAEEFNKAFDKFEKEENKEELVVYVKLVKDIKESKIKIERRDILLNGQNLGSDKKIAARKIAADQELLKEFMLI